MVERKQHSGGSEAPYPSHAASLFRRGVAGNAGSNADVSLQPRVKSANARLSSCIW
jgi:hypothetical protein